MQATLDSAFLFSLSSGPKGVQVRGLSSGVLRYRDVSVPALAMEANKADVHVKPLSSASSASSPKPAVQPSPVTADVVVLQRQ